MGQKYTAQNLHALLNEYVFVNGDPYQIQQVINKDKVILASQKDRMELSIKRFNELVELGHIEAPEPPKEGDRYYMLEVQRLIRKSYQRQKRIETLLRKQEEYLEKLTEAMRKDNKRSVTATKKQLEKIHRELMELEYYPYKEAVGTK